MPPAPPPVVDHRHASVGSRDGTVITYDAWGSGPLVVIVGGAFNDRHTWAGLAHHLSRLFTVVSYDRRGRGDSTDTPPYAVQREIEDLAALIDAASPDGTAYLHGISSGGALALHAAAAGLPVRGTSVLEPPYRVPGAPPVPEHYTSRLAQYLQDADAGGAVEFFMREAVGLPAEAVEPMRGSAQWEALCRLAPTLLYDAAVLGGDDQGLPSELLGAVAVPTLGISSTGSPQWMADAARATSEAVQHGTYRQLEGGFHEVPPDRLAHALAIFYSCECSAA